MANVFEAVKGDANYELQGAYNPKSVEKGWYEWWERCGFFTANNSEGDERPTYVICLPPPNVTGSLHLGHTLTTAIQDSIVRWRRMRGENVLWLPGTDHAGIATQVVVEKKLMSERKLTRHELGRDNFVKEVWNWKQEYGSRIVQQLRRTGASLDWSRECFTMDEKLSRAVTEAFVRLFEQGKIYRASRMVNWCCKLKTAISDMEVEYEDIVKSTKLDVPGHERKIEFGVITSFAYKVEGSDEEIVVATTRPETILGDTAVAIHPEDPRYKHLHGKFVTHPFNGRRIPIVCDPVLVDMAFGTGAVKVTPAHDPNDFECGKRNNLPEINILNDDGTLNENGAPYTGMKRFEARYQICKDLEDKGLLRGRQDHTYRLGRCSRTGDIIEPMIRPQWFCDCKAMAQQAADLARSGELNIIPEFHRDTWYRWLDNIRDWCISRQLWWGHRIPAYIAHVEGQSSLNPNETNSWIVGRTYEEALQNAAKKFNVDPSKIRLTQDEDVLDTWFSSGLFPFSTMGWPDKTPDMNKFFPGNLLETGHDILFFWVARMVMMSLSLTGKLPFNEVYLHAMVRDKFGRKMSKSLGNVIDPIDVIEGITLQKLAAKLLEGNLDPREVAKAEKGQKEQFEKSNGIPECGTDALRFALLAYTLQGRDINLDILRVVGYRNFCNKMWNAVKFTLTHLKDFQSTGQLPGLEASEDHQFADQWILSKLQNAIEACNTSFAEYNFSGVTTATFNFWLYELCDVYLELIKPVMSADQSVELNARRRRNAQNVLYTCVEQGLRLLHPVMPFVTEELWQYLPGQGQQQKSIMLAPYPTSVPAWKSEKVESELELMMEIVHKFRSIKAAYNLTNNNKPQGFVKCRTEEMERVIRGKEVSITGLSWLSEVIVISPQDNEIPGGCVVEIVNTDISVLLMLKGQIDIAAEIKKLETKKTQINTAKAGLEKKMNAANYEKVPQDVKEQNVQKLAAQDIEIASLTQAISQLTAMSNE